MCHAGIVKNVKRGYLSFVRPREVNSAATVNMTAAETQAQSSSSLPLFIVIKYTSAIFLPNMGNGKLIDDLKRNHSLYDWFPTSITFLQNMTGRRTSIL